MSKFIEKRKKCPKNKCLLCGKAAKYVEYSPDGPEDYFCSIKHHKINQAYFWAKGLSWRALELEKVNLK